MIPASVSFLNPDNAESWTSTRIVLAIKQYNNLETVASKHGGVSYSREGRGGGRGGGGVSTAPRFQPKFLFDMQHLNYEPSGGTEETSQSLNLNISWGTISPPCFP